MQALRRSFGSLLLSCSIGIGLVASISADAQTLAGDVAQVKARAFGTAPGTSRNELNQRDPIYVNHLIETTPEGGVDIGFRDGTQISVGADTQMVVDEFVYRPQQAGGTAQTVLTLSRGVMRFVSGLLEGRDNVKVATPTAVIGVRGTDFLVKIDSAGKMRVGTISGLVTVTFKKSQRSVDIAPGEYISVGPENDEASVQTAPVSIAQGPLLAFFLGGDLFTSKANFPGPRGSKDEEKYAADIVQAPPPPKVEDDKDHDHHHDYDRDHHGHDDDHDDDDHHGHDDDHDDDGHHGGDDHDGGRDHKGDDSGSSGGDRSGGRGHGRD